MSLSAPDREYIREVAINCAGEVSKEVIKDVLKWHVDACPHGKTIIASKWGLAGWCLGSGVFGGGLAAMFINIFAG